MPERKGETRWRRLAGGAFVLVSFGFLALFVLRNLGELRAQEWSVRPGLLGLSLLLHILALCWGVGVWRFLLRSVGHRVPVLDLARIWFLSGLGRYIPGKIWQFVGAAHIGRSAGLPAALTVTSLAVHTFYFLIAALLVSVYVLPSGLGIPSGALAAIRWLAPSLLILVHPAPLAAIFRLARRMSGRELVEWRGSWTGAISVVLLAVVGWLLTGSALYLFLRSLTPLPSSALSAVIGMNAVAFVAGNAVFIAPAGLGAKEGALAVMLAVYMTGPGAAILAVAARFWTIAAEVIPAVLLLGRTSGKDAATDPLPTPPPATSKHPDP